MPARRRLDNRYKLPPRAKQLTGETRRQWRPVLYRGVVAYGSRRHVRRPYRHDVRRVGAHTRRILYRYVVHYQIPHLSVFAARFGFLTSPPLWWDSWGGIINRRPKSLFSHFIFVPGTLNGVYDQIGKLNDESKICWTSDENSTRVLFSRVENECS